MYTSTIESVMAKMAKVVDGQNEHGAYQPMANNEQSLKTSIAYQAALALF
ncbi:hypothetical protein ACOBV9_22665 (plasmid) [Pseudoalteromonas espejiana]